MTDPQRELEALHVGRDDQLARAIEAAELKAAKAASVQVVRLNIPLPDCGLPAVLLLPASITTEDHRALTAYVAATLPFDLTDAITGVAPGTTEAAAEARARPVGIVGLDGSVLR